MRSSQRCPGKEFLDHGCDQNCWKKFQGQFLQIVNHQGAACINPQRFFPLGGEGKPLWAFKEFDHRIYCRRDVNGNVVDIVLFNGWIKDKKAKRGQSQEETNEIKRAKTLLEELRVELIRPNKKEEPR